MPSRPLLAAIGRHRRKTLLGVRLSDTFTTFTTANATPTADGTTPTTLTFTAKDATDTAVPNVSVTYA